MMIILASVALAVSASAPARPAAQCDAKPFTLKKPAPKPVVSEVPVTKPLPKKAKIVVGCKQPLAKKAG